MNEKEKIPLFPLNIVLLPETPMQLHIFEERYKEMINECINKNTEFGLVFTTASKMKTVGCTARIERVMKEYDDGRLDIQIKGIKRFRILDISDERSFLQAEVDFFDDDDTDSKEDLIGLAEEGFSLLKKLQTITQRDEFIEDMKKMNYKTLSFYFGAAYGFTAEEKQHFLELRRTSERLEMTIDGLRNLVQRIRMLKAIEEASLESKKKYGFSTN